MKLTSSQFNFRMGKTKKVRGDYTTLHFCFIPGKRPFHQHLILCEGCSSLAQGGGLIFPCCLGSGEVRRISYPGRKRHLNPIKQLYWSELHIKEALWYSLELYLGYALLPGVQIVEVYVLSVTSAIMAVHVVQGYNCDHHNICIAEP